MGKFVKNTVPGKQRGKKYTDAERTACLCDMIIEQDMHKVAQRHGVPESTLRTWWNKHLAQSAPQQRQVWADAYRQQMERIAHDGAAGVRTALEMANTRLAQAQQNAARCEEIDGLLVAHTWGDIELPDHARAAMMDEKQLRPPMGDYPLANYARMFMSVSDKAFAVSGGNEDEGAGSFTLRLEVDK